MVCPHCQSPAETGHAYCTHCGMALPAAEPCAPRIVPPKAFAATGPGRTLQLHELFQQARRAVLPLGWYTFLYVVGAVGILAALIHKNATRNLDEPPAPLGTTLVIATGIWLLLVMLTLWARRNPFPAAITGLITIISFHVIGVLSGPFPSMGDDGGDVMDMDAYIFGFVVGAIINLIILSIFVVYLSKAIAAGARHRTLLRLQVAGAAHLPQPGTIA